MAYLSTAESLPGLPEQPADVSWSTRGFESAPPAQDVDIPTLAREATAPWQSAGIETFGKTRALLLVHRGRLVREAYSPALGTDTSFRSWSMAKSLLHAVVGLLIGDGKLDRDAPAVVPAWGSGIFSANGFRGQYIVVDPRRDVVAVRLGSSSDEPRSRLEQSLARMLACFPPVEPECESRGGR